MRRSFRLWIRNALLPMISTCPTTDKASVSWQDIGSVPLMRHGSSGTQLPLEIVQLTNCGPIAGLRITLLLLLLKSLSKQFNCVVVLLSERFGFEGLRRRHHANWLLFFFCSRGWLSSPSCLVTVGLALDYEVSSGSDYE